MHWFWLAWFQFKERWRTSLWMIPGCFVIGAILLANLIIEVEQEFWVEGTAFPDRSTTVSILTAMFGGLLTFSGFIITMLLLVPPFVSAQLSPRVLQLWLRRPYLKIALGLLFGATSFAFTVLNAISNTYVPSAATGAAAILTFGAILVFLAVLSGFVHNLRPATMSDYLSRVGMRAVLATYPRPFQPGDDAANDAEHSVDLPDEPQLRIINSGSGRVIQAINQRALVANARRLDAILVFPYAIGEYVHSGAPLIEVHHAHRRVRPGALRLSVLLGEERTILQDPALVLRILVDIAIKGLSPAINDPTTATQVMHRIEELLVVISTRDLTANDLYDSAGTLRVMLPTWTWGDYVRLATREIRLYGGGSWQTTRRLRGMLEDLLTYVPEERRGVLEEELALLDWTLDQQTLNPADRAFSETADREGIGVRGARPTIDWRDMVLTIEARTRRSWPLRRR